MRSIILFVIAGLCEIGGGYLVWVWFREQRPAWFGIAGFVLLALYGMVSVFQPIEHPFGRIYAAYGAVFILLSVLWGWGIDRHTPDLRDCIGAALCLCGASVIMWPRIQSIQP